MTRCSIRPALAAAALALAAAGCRPQPPAHEEFTVMGTVASIMVEPGRRSELGRYTAIARAVFDEVNQRMSLYRDDSELAGLNRAAGGTPVTVSPGLRDVLLLSKRYSELTGGAFDVTVAPLVRLWGFSGGARPDGVPDAERIRAALALVGSDRLTVDGDRARLSTPGMMIDLGGIAKGYAVDVCVARLLEAGATNFLVNLGGNMRAIGHPRRGDAWRIGVRNPFRRDETIGTLRLESGQAVATSGNYERFIEIDGKRYTHIIDPRTGMPLVGMAGVTVTAPTAGDSDGLSTGLFILGVERGTALVRTQPGAGALFVPDSQPPTAYVTPEFAARFDPVPAWRDRVRIVGAHAP